MYTLPPANTRGRFSASWYLPQVLLILALLPIVILALAEIHGAGDETSLLSQLTINANYVGSDGDGHLLSFTDHARQAKIDLFLPGKVSRSQKIRLDYTATENIRALGIEIPQAKPPKDPQRHQNRIIDGKSGSFTFGLNDTDSRTVTLVLYGYDRKTPMSMKFSAIDLSRKQFIDTNLFFLLLMLGVGSSLVLIGCFSGFVLQKVSGYGPRTSGLFVLLGLFVYSIILLLALLAFQAMTADNYSACLLVFTILLTIAPMAVCYHASRDQQESFVSAVKTPVALYLLFTLIVAILVGCIDGIALQEYYWSLIGRLRMFDGHTAHDNVFQYLNALAIADNRTFNSFYQAPPLVKHLLFGVEDRQVLMGAIIGAYLVLWGELSAYATKTFGFFVIIGSCFSLFIIFPLYAFFAAYFRRYIVVLALFLLLMTTYVLGNIYYTWFKILGGAFILAGVYFLHFEKEPLKSWIIAGVFWSLALNMHAGQVIIYPLLALYFFFAHVRGGNLAAISRSACFTIVLTMIVIAGVLPWETIKHVSFPNDGELFRMHLLGSEKYAGSTFETIRNFFDRYSLAEQLSQRGGQLLQALRLEDIRIWFSEYPAWQLKDYLLSWNRLQFRYIPFMLYPLVILFVIAFLGGKLCRIPWTVVSSEGTSYHDLNRIFFLSLGCVIWGLVIMFTRFEAVSSSFVSQFATLFILMFLHCRISAYSRLGFSLMAFYAVLCFTKLYIYFSDIVDFNSLL